MLAFLRRTRERPLSKANASRLEQLTLTVSLYCVAALVIGSLGYGLYIGSDVVIANGIFSLFSLLGSGLNLAAAKLVARPADNKFQYGYWHVEPLVLSCPPSRTPCPIPPRCGTQHKHGMAFYRWGCTMSSWARMPGYAIY